MKKLLLASIIMIGFSSLAAAQKLGKEAPKKDNNTPALTNANQETAVQATAAATVVATEKTDAETAKQLELKKARAIAPEKTVAPKKTVAPAKTVASVKKEKTS